jgi:hypothetical protein
MANIYEAGAAERRCNKTKRLQQKKEAYCRSGAQRMAIRIANILGGRSGGEMRGEMQKMRKKTLPRARGSPRRCCLSYISPHFSHFLGGGSTFYFYFVSFLYLLYLYSCVLHVKCKLMRVRRELETRLLLQGIHREVCKRRVCSTNSRRVRSVHTERRVRGVYAPRTRLLEQGMHRSIH